MLIDKIVTTSTGIALTASLIAASAAPAMAWPSDLDPGQEFRYNYHSYAYRDAHGGDATGPHGVGSERDFYSNIQNLAGYTFVEYGNGQSQTIKNNAGSVYNITGRVVDVFYNSYGVMGCWCGTHESVGWGTRDLTVTKNDNASHHATGQVA